MRKQRSGRANCALHSPKHRCGGRSMQYKRISADCHLDLPWLPPELFVSDAKRELKERMPYVEDGPDGPYWVTKAGCNMGLGGGIRSGGGENVPRLEYPVDKKGGN